MYQLFSIIATFYAIFGVFVNLDDVNCNLTVGYNMFRIFKSDSI